MVQQMHPFGRSWISAPCSCPAARNRVPSTETSPNSLMSTATRRSGIFFSNPQIKVVLPEPRNPVTIVTGIFIVSGRCVQRGQRAQRGRVDLSGRVEVALSLQPLRGILIVRNTPTLNPLLVT